LIRELILIDMIEKFLIKNELTLKRYRTFKKNKRNVVATIVFLIILFISLTAEVWSNDKPLVLHYKGELISPFLKHIIQQSLDMMIF
jgi:microcin C transport system permease protein